MSDFLRNFFDGVYLINLKRRRDRLVRFKRRIEEIGGWPFSEMIEVEAVDGSQLAPPVGYKSGHGAWGCKQSHIYIHQRAIMDGKKCILILEDDAEFREDFVTSVEKFLKGLPEDWEGLMLGGQNMKPPEPVTPGIGRCRNTQRTHALAFRGNAIKDVLRMYYSCDVHIDWRLGPFLGGRKRTYQPVPFLVGQSSSKSDITLNRNTAKFWNAPSIEMPVLLLLCPQVVAEHCRKQGCHYGAHLDELGRDTGLNEIFPAPGEYCGGVADFISLIKWEAESFAEAPAIPTVWHPNMTKGVVQQITQENNRVQFVVAEAESKSQADEILKAHEVFKEYYFERQRGARKPVLLLKTPREVADRLQDEMIVHTGYWKNEDGIDKGLEARFWAAWQNKGPVNLRDWYSTVYEEADHLNALVGIWHPDATVEIAETCGERVVVVEADSYEEAVKQADAAIP